MNAQPLVRPVSGHSPSIDPSAWVAPGAVIVGNVRLEAGSSIWFNTVLRGDKEAIVIGEGSNVQDNCAAHVAEGFPLTLGKRVSVGHGAVIHGSTIEDDCLIGMGSVVLDGAHIGTGSLVAAGAVVLGGTVVPPGSLVAGTPAKVRRQLSDEEKQGLIENAESYYNLRDLHRSED